MPGWIHMIHRIIRTVGIQMQCLRVGLLTPVGVLCQEPSIRRFVVACIAVVEPGLFVPDLSGVAELIVKVLSRQLFRLPELVVLIGCRKVSILVCQGRDGSANIAAVQIPFVIRRPRVNGRDGVSSRAQHLESIRCRPIISIQYGPILIVIVSCALCGISVALCLHALLDPLSLPVVAILLGQRLYIVLTSCNLRQLISRIISIGDVRSKGAVRFPDLVAVRIIKECEAGKGISSLTAGGRGHLIQFIIGVLYRHAPICLLHTVSGGVVCIRVTDIGGHPSFLPTSRI